MTEHASRPSEPAPPAPANDRLDSWKEIGAYLKRDVTTVRRWERREGLPVHRHLHDRRESVYAYRHEIDQWWGGRRNHLVEKSPTEVLVDRSLVRRGSRTAWVLAAAFVGTTLAAAGGLVMYSRQERSAAERRDSSPGDAQLTFPELPPPGAVFRTVALSPDGRHVAFTATRSDRKTMLWVRALHTQTAIRLPGTEDASFPFWSPDGQSIAFIAQGSLKKTSVAGGPPQVICAAPSGRGGTWNADGTILFSPSRESGLSRVADNGGTPTQVTTVDHPRERGHLWPEFLPDGRHFLYLADSSEAANHSLFVDSLESSNRKRLFALASDARYTPQGYLLFASLDGRLVAQRFDAARLEPVGEPLTIAADVLQPWDLDHKTDFSISSTGLLMFRGMRGLDVRLGWRDRANVETALVTAPAHYTEPTLSPDQKRVALALFDPRPSPLVGVGVTKVTSDIWMFDPQSGAGTQFTFDPAADFGPVWSPDGTRLVFSSNRGGDIGLYQKRIDGTGGEEPLLTTPGSKQAQVWSPDGRYLVYATYNPDTRVDLWRLPMTTSGVGKPEPLLRTKFNEEQAIISPDGQWFAYTSDETGQSEVYVRSFPSGQDQVQLSTHGGGDPRWRADGRELYYIADDRRLMAVSVTTGATFERGAVTPLFDTGMQPHWAEARNHYDVSRDGQFLFMSPVVDDRAVPFTVIINWAAHLRGATR